MNRISPARYALYLFALVAVLGGVGLLKGGLFIANHEGDAVHMIDIVLRMIEGQVPHLDFSTPIGIFAFLPIVWASELGFGMGMSYLLAQVVLALVLLPMVFHVAMTRLGGLAAWAFGFIIIALMVSLVHGEDKATLAVSMYYNRWAWAMTFVLVPLAAIAPHEDGRFTVIEGVMAGLLMAALALIKPTYFIAFLLPVVLGFMLRGALRSLLVGLVTGALVALICVLLFGTDFFIAYINDLLTVATSEVRSAPGLSFVEVINAPAFLVGTLCLFFGIIVLRQGGQDRAGLLLLLLAPGFFYTTYQNFGNDPLWLMFLALFLMAHRPERGRRVLFNADARNAVGALALVSFALIAPSYQNIATSPFRHFGESAETYSVQIEGRDILRDVFVNKERRGNVTASTVIVDQWPQLEDYVTEIDDLEMISFQGETIDRCSVKSGDAAFQRYMSDRLASDVYGFGPEAQFYVADIVSYIWIIGEFKPLLGGAPWYYGGTPGLENADAIVVPLCPLSYDVARKSLKAVEEAGLTLELIDVEDVMRVYRIVK